MLHHSATLLPTFIISFDNSATKQSTHSIAEAKLARIQTMNINQTTHYETRDAMAQCEPIDPIYNAS
jgi:hypothetical protein